jgi:hypothetical protein
VTFVDADSAVAFTQHASASSLTINSRRVKLGWGKHPGMISPDLLMAIQLGANRNVYIGAIPDFNLYTEAKLKEDFSHFGGEFGQAHGRDVA